MISRVLAITLVGVAVVLAFFLWSRRDASKPSKPSKPTAAAPIIDDYDHAGSLKLAMKHMGFEPDTVVGNHWRAKGCREISYILDAGGDKLFLFLRDVESGEITKTMLRAQVDDELHKYISFEGSFGNSTIAFDRLGEMHYLGREPDNERADVYVRLNEAACGVQVDRVLYRGLRGGRVVEVNIQLLPGTPAR